MLSRSRAFTLTELLCCIGILGVLFSIGFTLSAPMREKSRQSACGSNLKQLYHALQLYSADYSDTSQVPGLQLSIPPSIMSLSPFLNSREVFFCPDATAKAHKNLASTYQMTSLAELQPQLIQHPQLFTEQFKLKGSDANLAYCAVHDVLYYQPRWQVDPAFAKPYLVQLKVDGRVVAGRSDAPRDTSLLQGRL